MITVLLQPEFKQMLAKIKVAQEKLCGIHRQMGILDYSIEQFPHSSVAHAALSHEHDRLFNDSLAAEAEIDAISSIFHDTNLYGVTRILN